MVNAFSNTPESSSLKRRLEEGTFEEKSTAKIHKLNHNSTSIIESLSNELFDQIFQNLSLFDWGRMSLVNKRFLYFTNSAYENKKTLFNIEMVPTYHSLTYKKVQQFFLHQGKKFINLRELELFLSPSWTTEEKEEMVSFSFKQLVQNEKTLKHLSFNNFEIGLNGVNQKTMISQIAKCQSLQSFSLFGMNLDQDTAIALGSALPPLENCKLECVTNVEYFLSTMAQSSSKLKTFHLQVDKMNEGFVNPLQMLFDHATELSSLRYLSTDDNDTGELDIDFLINQFLPNIKSKSLKVFSCRIPEIDNAKLFKQELENLISRSPELESFTLHEGYNVRLDDIPLHELLSCKTLKSLCLTHLSSDNEKEAEQRLVAALCASVYLEKFETTQKLSAKSLSDLNKHSSINNFSFLMPEAYEDEDENYPYLLDMARIAFKMNQKNVTLDDANNIGD
jgi:hypothetical protein